jgi:hypothetical protein
MGIAGFFDSSAARAESLFCVRSADGCAMAEILVLDMYARRLSAAGVCFCGVSIEQAMRQRAPGFPTVSIVLRIVFFLLFPVSCAGGFSLAVARPCIVIPVVFSL